MDEATAVMILETGTTSSTCSENNQNNANGNSGSRRASGIIVNTSSRQNGTDCVKYRKGIRVISVIDFTIAMIMLFLLSFGFFRVRRDATADKSVQAFILGMYTLYSIQILVSVILYKGTHKDRPAIIARSFKQWSTTSNFLNVMLCAEVYFFILIVEGRVVISMTICFLKVIFRGIAIQIVNYSIREMMTTHNLSFSSSTGFLISSSLLNSSTNNTTVGVTESSTTTDSKPPAYEEPPKYEEAIKMCMENEIIGKDETKT